MAIVHFPWISRRIVIGLVVFALTLGGFLLQPTGALAGVGGSPGWNASISDGTSNT
ncbi:MAG: hypothetical protein ACRDJH_19145 [Thermomicrobiales bacterium]